MGRSVMQIRKPGSGIRRFLKVFSVSPSSVTEVTGTLEETNPGGTNGPGSSGTKTGLPHQAEKTMTTLVLAEHKPNMK